MTILWIFFEVAGTIAFAISGALVGISRRMDIFGILVLALSTAIGGGIIRDVLVGNIPPNSFKSPLYIALTALTTLIIFIIYRQKLLNYRSKQKIRKYYLVADTLGLASFTVTGTTIGFSTYPQYPLLSITLGLVTAIGGGIIRDILAQRIPSVLQEEIYALPAILGSCVYLLIANFNLFLAVPISFLAVFIIRIIGIYYRLNLPKVN
ncbi:hypothetical protein B5F82_05525 [Megamonas hypermegale]|uniref:trimeric intracellular cation channel family protein n=1 Tax=Megamonas hypermegale TaxID=158847 RepID=UPI000B368B1A|nr:trimeric intracellular cation channel family protein [Megamonas hypermegale]OUO40111.1 hypothetical protein B5F82_05525 [Megamonas hypermegale]